MVLMPRSMPSLVQTASELAPLLARVADGALLVGLDFDGTLSPIVDRPEDARLETGMQHRLSKLSALVPTAVISGRDLDALRTLAPVAGLTLVGSHGLEISRPDGVVERADGLDRSDADLSELIERLHRTTGGLKGVLVEPKRHSVAVHWRTAAPSDQDAAEQAVLDAARQVVSFKVVTGKMFAELRPAIERDKGGAVVLLQSRVALNGAAPTVLYIGDDVTDEDAFQVLDPAKDVGILVASSPRPSAATWRLPDIAAVAGFLDRLIQTRQAAPTP